MPGYTEGIRLFLGDMAGIATPEEIGAVGFKTVLAKGFYGVHELTDEVLRAMRDISLLPRPTTGLTLRP